MTCKRKILLILAAAFAASSQTASDQAVGVIEIYSDQETPRETQSVDDTQGTISASNELETARSMYRGALNHSGEFNLDLAHMRNQIRNAFEDSDENDDGYLTFDEFKNSNRGLPIQYLVMYSLEAARAVQRSKTDLSPDESAEWKQAQNTLGTMIFSGITTKVPSTEAEFNVIDVDGDGQLSRDEFGHRHERMREFTLQQRFLSNDVNGDEYVEFYEYVAPLEKFHALDKDQNGYVNIQELVQDSVEGEAEW